ncbi:hypothetical protein BH23BAC4_BH23BAC4_15030 [soil metagenome]
MDVTRFSCAEVLPLEAWPVKDMFRTGSSETPRRSPGFLSETNCRELVLEC